MKRRAPRLNIQPPKPAIAWSTFHVDHANMQEITARRSYPDGGVFLTQGTANIFIPITSLAAFKRAVNSLKEIES